MSSAVKCIVCNLFNKDVCQHGSRFHPVSLTGLNKARVHLLLHHCFYLQLFVWHTFRRHCRVQVLRSFIIQSLVLVTSVTEGFTLPQYCHTFPSKPEGEQSRFKTVLLWQLLVAEWETTVCYTAEGTRWSVPFLLNYLPLTAEPV